MDIPTNSPLGAEHLGIIDKALEDIKVGVDQADLAARAGLDVVSQLKQLDEYQQKLLKLKQVYFPGS